MALQIRRRIGGPAAPPPSLEEGQLAYNQPATGSDALYIGDGTGVELLIGSDRQVELTGDQTVTGHKTIDVGNLHIEGGADGDVLSTDGAGVLDWVAQPPASVEVDAPLTGNGLTATPLGLDVATAAQITTGTDDVNPITSLGLRGELGADAATLTTNAKTVVPAINEIDAVIRAMDGPVQLVGTYDATAHQITSASPFITDGPLPAAAAANKGWVVVVDVAGTGVAPAPTVAMSPGDWLLSTGTQWIHLDLHAPSTIASNVGTTAITGLTATNVQAALEEIVAGETVPVAVDLDTMSGDGTTASPLNALLDDGVY